MPEIYKIAIIDAALLVALFTAFIILLISKVGLRDYIVSTSRLKIISQLFSCDFCLCFWINLILCLILSIVTGNILCLALCIFSTPLARIFL